MHRRPRPGRFGGFVLFFAAILQGQACERAGPSADSERAESAASAIAPVAKVGPEVITAREVMSLMDDKNLSARQALEQLVDEAVLFHAAEEAGIQETSEDRREIERLMVRALLRVYEAELSPERMSDEDVRAAFEEHRDRLAVPEKRASIHVLVRDQGPEAEKLAWRALREFRREDPKTVMERYVEGKVAHRPEIEVIAEELPAFSMTANIEEPYKKALFAAEQLGPLSKPVRTSYGWHAIVLTEILASAQPSLERSEPELRQWLAERKRHENLVRVIEPLKESLVEWNEPVVRRLTQAERLPELEASGPGRHRSIWFSDLGSANMESSESGLSTMRRELSRSCLFLRARRRHHDRAATTGRRGRTPGYGAGRVRSRCPSR